MARRIAAARMACAARCACVRSVSFVMFVLPLQLPEGSRWADATRRSQDRTELARAQYAEVRTADRTARCQAQALPQRLEGSRPRSREPEQPVLVSQIAEAAGGVW